MKGTTEASNPSSNPVKEPLVGCQVEKVLYGADGKVKNMLYYNTEGVHFTRVLFPNHPVAEPEKNRSLGGP